MNIETTIERNVHRASKAINRNVNRTTSKVENTFGTIKEAAVDGLHLGMGLVAMVSQNIGSFVKDTVEYGEKVEKKQLKLLKNLQSGAVDRVKGLLSIGENPPARKKATVKRKVKTAAKRTATRIAKAGKKAHRTASRKVAKATGRTGKAKHASR